MKSVISISMHAVAIVGMSIFISACGAAPVQPWEKGTLARPEMSLEGDKLETKFAEHIYTSREGASGGSGVGGGGCGCN